MESNEVVRQQILEIVNNQMKSNSPEETNETFKRLVNLGYDKNDAKLLIGQCVAVEIFDILKNKVTFNLERYITNLKNLPKEPFA